MTAKHAPAPVEVAEQAAVAIGMGENTAREFAGHFMEKARALGLMVSTHLPAPNAASSVGAAWARPGVPRVAAEGGKVRVTDLATIISFVLAPENAELFAHHLRAAAPYARRQAEEIEKENES